MSVAALAAWAVLAASPAGAQQAVRLKRGDLSVVVPVSGTVVVSDVLRLKAQIDGRVEDVQASSYSWVTQGNPLAYLATKEMAAMLDSHTTTERDTVEDRWKRVYQPAPVQCETDCFVLRVFVRSKEWVKPRALLFEAAQRVQLVGRVRPEDAHWVRDGQTLEFWPKSNPENKMRTRIVRYVLDVQARKEESGGSFAVDLTPKKYLEPGTPWEGRILPLTRKGVIIAPTAALIDYDGETYLPVKVSVGVTTEENTEITAGVDDRRPILILDEAKLARSRRHQKSVNVKALEKRLRDQADGKPTAETEPSPKTPDSPEPDNSTAPREATTPVPSRHEPEPRRDPQEKAGPLPDPDATFSEHPNGE